MGIGLIHDFPHAGVPGFIRICEGIVDKNI
jgi:hypothetical protein